MKLQDLPPKTPVIIEVDIGNNIYTLETKVATTDYAGLLLMPIYSQGQMLDFSLGIFKDATINMYAVTQHGATRLQWKNVTIETTKRKIAYFYKVSVSAFNSMAQNVNRRGNNRFPVLGSCSCCIVETGAIFPAEMSDVSVSGIAFHLKAELPLKNILMDIDYDDLAGGIPYHIHVQARCIRIMPKDGMYIYGCQLTMSSQELLIYLSNKQEDVLRAPIEEEANNGTLSDEEALRQASTQNMGN